MLRIATFLICHHCSDVHSDVDNPPTDPNDCVCGHPGQCLAHSRCSVHVIKRMSECQRLRRSRQEQPGKPRNPGEGVSYALSFLTATKKWGFGFEEAALVSVSLSFRFRKENPHKLQDKSLGKSSSEGCMLVTSPVTSTGASGVHFSEHL